MSYISFATHTREDDIFLLSYILLFSHQREIILDK